MSGFKRYTSRYAHCQGFSHCTYSESGSQIISCGRDGDIRIFNGRDDDDPTSRGISEYVTCVVHYDERVLLSSDMNTVVAYTFPECKKEDVQFRFSAPATSIKVNAWWIAAGSEDFSIKVVKRDKSDQAFELEGHEAPVICIDICEKFLASRGGDGKLIVWDLDAKSPVHTVNGLELCKAFELAVTFETVSFDPKGKTLAYCNAKQIIVLECSGWTELFTLSDNVVGVYTVCAFSPTGLFLVAGTSRGELNIWSAKTQKSLPGAVKGGDIHAITSIAWNPDCESGELSFCDLSGQVEVVTNITDVSKPSKPVMREVAEEDEVYNEYGLIDDEAEAMDADDDDAISLERLKNETLGIRDENMSDIDKRESTPSVRDIVPSVILQRPFQCGATPVDLEHRFMIWNHVGIVRSHKTDEEDSIEVEFHDTSTHHGIHINNHLNHSMASLSKAVLALACETPSKLVCITLKVGGNREWSVTMPDCEEIFTVCASDKLVAVATDARQLRIFTVLGTQREVISIPGPVITSAAHEDQIVIAYHAGASATNDQNINLMMFNCFGYNIRCKDIKLPLTPGSRLMWLGFTDKGSPVTYDSFGVLKLYRHKSNCWFPIWNGTEHTKGASDAFFILQVDESLKEIHAILCRGTQYPLTTPRPLPHVYQIEMPLCDIESEKSKLESILLKNRILAVQDSKYEVKESTIKLFALACKSELEHRARELIELMSMPELIPIAAKYANGIGRIHLAQKLAEMAPELEEKEKEIENRLNEPDIETTTFTNGSHNPLLSAPSIPSAPIIKPKPMFGGRNPFRKTSNGAANDIKISKSGSIFSHITEMGLGYTAHNDDTQGSAINSPSTDMGDTRSKTAEIPFTKWLDAHREECKAEFKDMEMKDFNKACLKKYKEWKEQRKRKMDENDGESGIKKLAKFAAP